MDTGKKEFGKWFKEELKKRGYRQNRFAEMIGVDFRTVNHWCKGDNYPGERIRSDIDEALGEEIGCTNAVINKFMNEEKGISDNDFDILLGIARKLKKRIVEKGIGKNDDEDVIDFDQTIESYRKRLVESYKNESVIPRETLQCLDNISNLDIYVYLFLSSANKDFKFKEYVNRFIFSPHSVRVATYYGRVKKMIERDDK